MKYYVEISKRMDFVIEADSREELVQALDELPDREFDDWGCESWDVEVYQNPQPDNIKADMGVANGEVLALEDYEKAIGRRLRVRKVEPVGVQRAWGFIVESAKTEPIDVPAYPHSAKSEKVREAREAAGLTLEAAAKAAGVGVAEWSGIETGSHAPESWDRAFEVLREATK